MSQNSFLYEACESVDAAVFTGDVLFCDEDRDMLAEYVARWQRAIAAHIESCGSQGGDA